LFSKTDARARKLWAGGANKNQKEGARSGLCDEQRDITGTRKTSGEKKLIREEVYHHLRLETRTLVFEEPVARKGGQKTIFAFKSKNLILEVCNRTARRYDE